MIPYRGVETLVQVVTLLLAASLAPAAVPERRLPDASHEFFTRTAIPHLRIRLDASALAALRLHPRAYVKASVTEGSVVYQDVGLHLKGNYGTFQTMDTKPSLTLNFDKFRRGQKFHGLDKLHLNNSRHDPSYYTELLCRGLFREAGLPAARVSHARVEVNGRDLGLFVLVEGHDRTFLRRHFSSSYGNLYDSEFMRDVSTPLRKSSGDGPDDHSDLLALAAAAEDPDAAARLAKLGVVLDLDRFYSFLALELMTCHFDGYARGKNNYWVYSDPRSGKMVFIPHGMDLMFWQPQSSLFPELKGVVAQAVLETSEGRKFFRERCTLLFTNLFPGLSNHVEEVRDRLRPVLAEIGTNAVDHHDRDVTALQRRISERIKHLRKELFAPTPKPTFLDPGGETLLTNWLSSVEQGRAALSEENSSAETRILHAKLEPGDKGAMATWQARVLLPKGHYRVWASLAADQPIFRGPERPVNLKVWADQNLQSESLAKDTQHLELANHFVMTSEFPEEALIQCRFESTENAMSCQIDRVVLTRVE